MEFRKHTLANGLTVVAECNDEAHTTALGFFVNTGSRDESADVWGVSHFLEHMVFKGTDRRTPDDVNREFDEMGADYNAYTSEENTVYYATVLPEHTERVVALWADVLRPALRQRDFDTEKQVIQEEIQMYEDLPPFGADDKCKAIHFAGHPLGRSVLGTVDSVGRLTSQQMRDYFTRRYSAGNITLAAAGRVDFARLTQTAERHCGHWPTFAAQRETPRHHGPNKFETIAKPTAAQQYLLHIADGPSATDEDRFAARLLTTIVGDDTGSRLFWELVDPGLAESASLHHYGYQGTGVFFTYISGDPDESQANLERIRQLYQQVEADGVTPQELAQAKSKLASRIVLGSERSSRRMFTVGSNWINRQEYRTIQDDLAAVDGVTLAQIRDLLQRYPLTHGTTVAVGPRITLHAPA